MIFPEFLRVLEQNGAYFPWEITEIMHIFPESISKLIGDMSNAIFIRQYRGISITPLGENFQKKVLKTLKYNLFY